MIDLDSIDLSELPDLPEAEDNGFSMRPYQSECIEAVESGWDEWPSQMVVLPTGAGKTVVFTRITHNWVSKGGRVLILAHTDELLDQAADKLRRSTGLVGSKEKGKDYAHLSDMVVLGSVQTMCRDSRLSSWAENHFDLVIVDECHRTAAKGYQKILLHFGGHARILGVTATPDRGDKRNLLEFYSRIAYQYTLLDAVRDGWLVRPIAQTIPLELDLRGVGTSRTAQGSDYSPDEVSHRIEPFLGQIAAKIREAAPNRKTIIFMPSIDTAVKMADALQSEGFRAGYVSGECPDRAEKIAAFNADEMQVICNAMLLTEGYDDDSVDCICVLRPTKIRSLFVQCTGRGTRPLAGIVPLLNATRHTASEERRRIIAQSRKPNMLILDFLWLTDRHDLIHPANLVARDAREADHMTENTPDGDLLENEAQAHRDLLAALEKAVAKNRKKKGRTVDPLTFAVSVGDEELTEYEPESRWDAMEPTERQVKALESQGIDVTKVQYRGLADKLLQRLARRKEAGLCSIKAMNFLLKQSHFLEKLGMSAEDVPFLPRDRASELCKRRITELQRKARKGAHGG